MILILEDDVDRQRFQEHRSPFSPEFFNVPDSVRMRTPTVWISPESYAKEAILATLRAQVDELHAESMTMRATANLRWHGHPDGPPPSVSQLDAQRTAKRNA